jgi:hypothetical protein
MSSIKLDLFLSNLQFLYAARYVDDYGVILYRCSERVAGSAGAGLPSRTSTWFLEASGDGIPTICRRQVPAATYGDLCAPGQRTAAGIQHPAHR